MHCHQRWTKLSFLSELWKPPTVPLPWFSPQRDRNVVRWGSAEQVNTKESRAASRASSLGPGFSTSALLTFGARSFLVRGHPGHSRVVISLPGLYHSMTVAAALPWQPTTSPHIAKCPLVGKGVSKTAPRPHLRESIVSCGPLVSAFWPSLLLEPPSCYAALCWTCKYCPTSPYEHSILFTRRFTFLQFFILFFIFWYGP